MAKITNQSTLTSRYELPDSTQQDSTTKSNIASTENMTTSFLKERESAKDFGMPKDEIMQTITLTNNSELAITDITVVDTISEGATFKAGSVTIDDVPQADADPTTGITLENDLAPSASCVIKYYLVMADEPVQSEVTCSSEITYSVGSAVGLVEETEETTISTESQKITITKTANKQAVISGDIITYTHEIKNEGSLNNTNLFFKDEIPFETQFVADSVKIDNVAKAGLNPVTGFDLEDLAVNQTIVVEFQVTVS